MFSLAARACSFRTLSQSSKLSTTSFAPIAGVKNYLVSFNDLFGVQRSKLVPAAAIESTVNGGAGFAGYAAHFDLSPADPDMIGKADWASAVTLPWNPEIAWVACDLFIRDVPLVQCPRAALRAQIKKAKGMGYQLKTGVEVEFMLLDPATNAIGDLDDTQPKACYDQQALMRRYEVISELMGYIGDLGWGPYQADHEDANGQFEINWEYDDAMVTADRHAFFMFMLKSVAEKHGLRATVMPKPFVTKTGNGCHIHMSLHDATEPAAPNVFKDRSGKPFDPEFGTTKLLDQFLGGLMGHTAGLCAVMNPTVNSYKRLGSSSRSISGATWAPTLISHGGNDRTHVVRIPDAPRIELRLPDTAANPYLLPAAAAAAGLDGIANDISPGPRATVAAWDLPDGTAEPLPSCLLDALRALEADTALVDALGPDLVAAYLKLRTQQWESYCGHLSQWELDTGLNA